MRNHSMKLAACILTGALILANSTLYTQASSALPSAGAAVTLESVSSIETASNAGVSIAPAETQTQDTEEAEADTDKKETEVKLSAGEATSVAGVGGVLSEPVLTDEQIAQAAQIEEEKYFSSLVIAKVNDYVNVRSEPSEEGEILGKLYNESVGEFISEQDGWYEIKSGSVTGFVKGEYVVTGEDAIDLAKQVGKRIATVNTTTLFVRDEATTESSVVGYVGMEDELTVKEDLDGWVKVSIEEGEGYISKDYIDLSTEFVKAESKAEEEARLQKEEAARQAANAAAAAADKKEQKSGKSSQSGASGASVSGGGRGSAVANYALQFVGNPYVYGGSSLTNGTDCSGFTMSVYAQFGVSLPHSSGAQRGVGYDVGGLANAQPGDIVCYSGHVGIYIGNGQIVHASTAATGIKVSNASYRQVLSVRRIF
ncbi:MAG: C40 family peptidase [Lachnospiraceae bacterium]|nr:C40 family peptidase [Lachnospiraceae bacterium]